MYESELIPLFEKCGTIWDLRLMMDPMTGLNRGYAFVTFTTRDAAHEAVRQVNPFFSIWWHENSTLIEYVTNYFDRLKSEKSCQLEKLVQLWKQFE